MRAAFGLCLLLTGCFGGTQNPSYFPYYLGTTDVIRTHAKPVGQGYFRNFDPKACRIELAPANSSNPTKAQVILIATVVDKDDHARRKRRVEWQLEGPGTIVEVDESGYLPGRGYQITDKFAVSYTDYLEHTITRGNNDPNDDFSICPGQTWCVVSCPVDGQTIVTAYAPEVYDWDKRRAFARLTWSDGGFMPTPTSGPVRSGRETDSSLMARAKADAPAGPSLMLDARLPKTVAVNRESMATISLANVGRATSAPATVRAVLPDGVDLVRSDPAPTRRKDRELAWSMDAVGGGLTKEIALVLRPNRAGAFTLAAAADTADGLAASTKAESIADAAGMSVSVEGPAFAAAGESTDVKIVVSNPGNVPIENAVAWVTPGAGLGPAGATSPVEVRVGSIPPGQSRTVNATLAAERTGKSTVRVDVTADGGLSARGEGAISVGKSELTIRIIGPETIPVGDSATFDVQVANASDISAKDVAVKVSLPRGLAVTTAKDATINTDSAAWTLATLAPGEMKTLRFAATGDRLSELTSITATASGSLAGGGKLPVARTSVPAAVRGQPVIVLELQAPAGTVNVGGKPAYRVIVRNRGNGPARDVVVSAELSSELKSVRSGGSRVAFERIAELAAGESKTLTLDADALTAGNARITVEVQSKDLSSPLRDEQSTRIVARK